ncbi:MAG: hypothetical protein LAO51_01980 [Acidobacteriia bacterium]|nr:hypothetical protein [Terriglobia bacterium]
MTPPGTTTHRGHRLALIGVLLLVAVACSGGGSNDVAGPENTVAVIVHGSGQVTCNESAQLVCPGTCGPMDWTPGMTVHLTATPDNGATFGGWTGSCTGADPNDCAFVVNGHMVVTATFN